MVYLYLKFVYFCAFIFYHLCKNKLMKKWKLNPLKMNVIT